MARERKVLRVTNTQRRIIQVSGLLAVALAILFFVLAMRAFFAPGPEPGDSDFMEGARDKGLQSSVLFLVFMAFFVVGSFLVRLGFLRPFAEIVATETEGALETAGGAVGRGWQQSAKAAPTGQEIRVRCRECGNLEREAAQFCSGCGKAM